MHLLVPYVALLCIIKVVSSHPAGLWSEYIADDNSSTNLIDSTFEYPGTSGTTSTTAVPLKTARDDDTGLDEETADGTTTSATTADEVTTATSAGEAITASTADDATTVTTADTSLAGQGSGSTTTNRGDSSTTIDADITTTTPQSSTLPPPTKQPPSDNPKKSWAEIFCEKVKQFFNFVGHKLTDTASFIRRLFHWLY